VSAQASADVAVSVSPARVYGVLIVSVVITVITTYVDWLASLPWSITTEDRLDVREAAKILDISYKFLLNKMKLVEEKEKGNFEKVTG